VVFERAFGEGQPTLQMRRSAFTGRRSYPWSYIVDPSDPGRQEELYRLGTDPEESQNVAVDHPEVVSRQRERLEAVIHQSLPAQFPEVCDHPIPSPIGDYLGRRAQWHQ